MKNEDLLDLLNEIDEEYIESASKRLENLHEFERKEFGDEMRPQVIRVERTPRKPVPFRTGALAAAAAVLVCAVTVGVYVKLNKPPSYSPGSGVVLSEASHISEPSVPELTSSEPISLEPTSSEPTVFEPAISEERLKRVLNEGYNFVFEIDNKKEGLTSGPFLKNDREKGITIDFECSDDCEGRSFTIEFYSFISRNKTVDKKIATLTFTARSYTQSFNVLYDENELKEGEECIMFLSPEDRDFKSHAAIKGKILP